MDGVDPAASARSLDDLRGLDLEHGELVASLRAVADATATIFEADGGGIMLLDEQQSLRYLGATSGRAAALEAAQEETGEGPCVDSLIYAHPVHTSDLVADERWPLLRAQLGELGVHAVLGVPLRVGLSSVGSLNVYRLREHTWSQSDIDAISAHAGVIEELLSMAVFAQHQHTIVGQLTQALEHRVTIDRATGVVMAATGLDAAQAFNRLRQRARSQRRRVVDLADEVNDARTFVLEDGR